MQSTTLRSLPVLSNLPGAPNRARRPAAVQAVHIASVTGGIPPGSPLWQQADAVALPDYRPGAEPVAGRFLWSADCLYARLEPVRPSGIIALFLDPTGDRGGYLEIAVDRSAQLWSRVARRSLSGVKYDLSWDCPGAIVEIDPSGESVALSIPFASLGSQRTEKPWLVGAARNPDFTTLRPAPPLLPLKF